MLFAMRRGSEVVYLSNRCGKGRKVASSSCCAAWGVSGDDAVNGRNWRAWRWQGGSAVQRALSSRPCPALSPPPSNSFFALLRLTMAVLATASTVAVDPEVRGERHSLSRAQLNATSVPRRHGLDSRLGRRRAVLVHGFPHFQRDQLSSAARTPLPCVQGRNIHIAE